MRDRVVDTTVRLTFNTNDADGAPVAPSSAFAASDFAIYKDGSATQKTTTDGVTVTSPFDSVVGLHLIEIDTSNDTNAAGFWVAGSEYRVAVSSAKTVDGVSQSGVIVGEFRLVTGTVELDSDSRAAILTQQLIESYAADGAAPTVAQALMMLLQHHQQKSVSGTTVTIKKLDKTTTAGTYTLDSATDPTSITRAT